VTRLSTHLLKETQTMKSLFVLCALAIAAGANAQVINIDQAKALRGSVTAGDAPGFPVTLSEPGSYRLMSNLVVADMATSGIVITSPGVSLDLNGFELSGPNVCTGPTWVTSCTADNLSARGTGVLVDLPAGSPTSVAISNGTLRGFAGYGARAVGGTNQFTVDRLLISHSGHSGIAHAAMVTRSVIDRNRSVGIHHSHSVIGNTISRNGGFPLWSSYIRHNTLVSNGAAPASNSLID
jgi:hypothetical protein